MSDGFENPPGNFPPNQGPGAPQPGFPPQGGPQQGFPPQDGPQQGFAQQGGPLQAAPGQYPGGPQVENKKIISGILALLLGGFGVHKFMLGYTNEGIIQLVATFFTCGLAGVIPIIEGIIYLTKSDEEFYQTYQLNKKGWF